jgi:hypothetical protein
MPSEEFALIIHEARREELLNYFLRLPAELCTHSIFMQIEKRQLACSLAHPRPRFLIAFHYVTLSVALRAIDNSLSEPIIVRPVE